MLPEWLDSDRVSLALVGGVILLAVAAFMVLRLIRRVFFAAVIAGVLIVGAVLLGVQWDSLRDCQETCSCEVFGRTIQVPQNPLCGPNRFDPSRVNLNISLG